MGWASAILLGALLVLAGAYVLYLYERREVGGPGLRPLAALRIATLAVILLLLVDPTLPAAATALGGSGSWTLVDGSHSMAAAGSPGSSGPWRGVVDDARDRGGPVLVFGDDDPLPVESVDATVRPPFPTSRLVPALERAAESGARSVRVVSDLRLEDAARARAAAERLGLEVVVAPVGGEVRSAGVAYLVFPGPLEGDEPASAEAAFFAVGTSPGDSLTVEVREEGRLVASVRLPAPGEGRLGRIELDLPVPEAEGEVRYTARVVLPGDAFPDDDERTAWADVDPEEGNLVLVSLDPDWELRFLVPVLYRVTGLPARGFVQVGPDRFLPMDPAGAGGTEDLASVEAMAKGAELLVVQASSSLPSWLEEALATVRRSVVLARGSAAAGAAGVGAGPPRPGEWYVSPEIPPSPLAGELAGAQVTGLPPLAAVLPLVSDERPGPVPMVVQLRGGDASEVAMVLVADDRVGRRAVALASGFWRWGFREGAGRDAYERLWSGVAGWLLADEPLARGPGVRPEERVVPWSEPVWWAAPGLAGTEVAIRLSRTDSAGVSDTGPAGADSAAGADPAAPDSVSGDARSPGGVVLDTVVTVPEGGRFRLPPMPPGTYRWRAEAAPGGEGAAPRTDGVDAERPSTDVPEADLPEADLPGADAPDARRPDSEGWEGRLDVERWTADLRHPRDTLLTQSGEAGGVAGPGGPGRPLRTHPLPYLLVLALLSVEWIGRRRKGLR